MGKFFTGAVREAQKYFENRGTFDKDPEGWHHKILNIANKYNDNALVKKAIDLVL